MPHVLLEIKLHNKCQVSVKCFNLPFASFSQFIEERFLGGGGLFVCLFVFEKNNMPPEAKAFLPVLECQENITYLIPKYKILNLCQRTDQKSFRKVMQSSE